MEKQIQQKFEEILTKLGFEFYEDGMAFPRSVNKNDLIELLEEAFNLGLEVAAEDVTMIYKENKQVIKGCTYTSHNEFSIYIDKNSILKNKL